MTSMVETSATVAPEELYLDLLKKCLTRSTFPDTYRTLSVPRDVVRRTAYGVIRRILQRFGFELVRSLPFDPKVRGEGLDWPAQAETMIGLRRMENIQFCVTDVLRRGVPGDLIETGVWRGGATIFMRGILQAYRDRERAVWVADSFQGLPKPNAASYPADANDRHWTVANALAIPVEQVRGNFARYGLLDDQVRFLVGWFRDTLPNAPIDRLAVMRLDGDMYESTMDGLVALYPKLSVGGYAIVDDYGLLEGCRQAVDDYRSRCGVTEPIHRIDSFGAYWRRER